MEECVHMTQMFQLPAKVNRGITPEWEKVSEKLDFSLWSLVYKF
jgi:hypothetical protein